MIELKDVSFKYKNGNNVLENINLQINEGEFVSIIGKNGNGKSSLLSLIAGITRPSKGSVLIDDIDTKSKRDFKAIRKNIGIVFQNPDNQVLFPKVYDDIKFALNNLGLDNIDDRVSDALKSVNMYDYKDFDTYELSLGQKQRINIASVLALKPKYVVLDEPTTMIDSLEKENIYACLKRLKESGVTIIFVTNNVDEILLSDRVLILQDKHIKYEFDKKSILDNVKLLEDCEIKVPDIIDIVLKLKENNVLLSLKEFTIDEMKSEILRLVQK